MKKKFLSLMMAAAVVATTSVSAFAADNVISDSDNSDATTNVTITGEVLNESGERPEGRFNVTIPTATSFTVNQSGKLQGTTIKVSNKGTQNIDVYADKFVDTKNGSGIDVVAESGLKTLPRTSVSLSLQGNLNTLYLKSEADGEFAGLYTNKSLSPDTKANATTSKIATVQSNQDVNLTLSGKAGDNGDQVTDAVSNDFTLTLKIKKSAK